MVTVGQQQQHKDRQVGDLKDKVLDQVTATGQTSSEAALSLDAKDGVYMLSNTHAQLEEDESRESTLSSDLDDSVGEDEGWDTDVPVTVATQHYSTDNGVELPRNDVPSFGDVCVKESRNVHLGNKTFYNGPVTIKQFVYTNKLPVSEENSFSADVPTGLGVKGSNEGGAVDDAGAKNNATTGLPHALRNFEDDRKVTGWCNLMLTWRCVALFSTLGSFLVVAAVVGIVLLSHDSERPATTTPPVTTDIPNTNDIILDNVRFIERNDWIAQPPEEPLTPLKHPVPYVIISHTASDVCKVQSECTARVRFIQTFHIESRNYSDIAYNFLVGGDGYAYVGRGWDSVGAHSFGFNIKSIGISFVGTFNKVEPPNMQLYAAQKVIEVGVKLGKIASDYKLLGHRQVSRTLSPGDALYRIIQQWPHWSSGI